MQQFLSDDSTLSRWKRAKQKQVLHKALISAGFCPSHYLIGKLTILRTYQQNVLREEFYLDYDSTKQKLLLRSFLIIDAHAVSIVFERCGCHDVVLELCEQETLQPEVRSFA